MITPREIYLCALAHHAVSIILLHNHPSGNPSPSREDILLTRRVKESGELLGIELLDHIIIGDQSAVSFSQRASAFKRGFKGNSFYVISEIYAEWIWEQIPLS